MKTLIVIPARYGSTRFPGKPLAKIAGKEMLLRVWENAQKAASKFEGCHVDVMMSGLWIFAAAAALTR